MLSDYVSTVGSTEVLHITLYTTAVQDIIAHIIVFKIFLYVLAVLLIEVYAHYPALSLLTTCSYPVEKWLVCIKTI